METLRLKSDKLLTTEKDAFVKKLSETKNEATEREKKVSCIWRCVFYILDIVILEIMLNCPPMRIFNVYVTACNLICLGAYKFRFVKKISHEFSRIWMKWITMNKIKWNEI